MQIPRAEFDEMYQAAQNDEITKDEFYVWVTDLLDEVYDNGVSGVALEFVDT